MSVLDEARALATGQLGYDELPELIKGMYTLEQWMWMGDAQKARLVQTDTEPDWTE